MDERDDTPDYKLICSRCHTNCEVCCEGSRRTGRRKFSLTLMLAAALVICYPNGSWPAAPDSDGATARPESREKFQTIHNDFYWVDQNGARILTRSGCLCRFGDIYYWYGGNPRGFREQNCYTSTDLVHWTNKGVVLRHEPDANRIDVLYNEATKQYVMFLKYDGNGAFLGIATAEKPEGPFTFLSKTLIDNARIGDMSVFKDTDGTAYLSYVSWAVGTNAQHGIYRMSADYLTPDKRMYLWDIRGREAPHIFKRNGIYYYGTSRTAGIQSSGTSYYTSTNLEGPWSEPRPLATPGSTNSWDSQVDFVYPIQGNSRTLYMFAGDRWIKDAAHGRNGDYVWLPLEFDGDTPMLNYYQDWEINVAAGEWRRFDPSRNLAVGKLATASSEAGTNVARHVTDPKTYQDYASTYWESEASDPQWISVDLGAAQQINRVILKWNVSAAKEYKVQTSTDGNTWTDVLSSPHGSSSSVTDETFNTTTVRYVRMYGTQRAPVLVGFGGRRRGLTGSTAPPAAQAANQAAEPAAQPVQPATPPSRPSGYSLFDFIVLRD